MIRPDEIAALADESDRAGFKAPSGLTRVQFVIQMVLALGKFSPGIKALDAIALARRTYLDFLRSEKIKFGDPSYDWTPFGAETLVREYEGIDRLSATSSGDAMREALKQVVKDAFNVGLEQGKQPRGKTWPSVEEELTGWLDRALAPAEKPRDERTIDPLTDCMNVALLIENGCDEKFARRIVNQWNEKCRDATPTPPSAGVDELARLKQGIRDIAQACVEGRVCDDVAWFTAIPSETLFDKCCNLLNEDLPMNQGGEA